MHAHFLCRSIYNLSTLYYDHSLLNPMQDVCLSTTRVALEFYRAARDAILLYESIIPVKVVCYESILDKLSYATVCLGRLPKAFISIFYI